MKTHLVFAVMTIALLAFVISRERPRTVTFENVVDQARALSLEPYAEIARERSLKAGDAKTVPPALKNLTYDQLRDIRFKEEKTLWRERGLPFQARFFYAAGEHSSTPVTLFEVNRNSARQIRFTPDLFTFGPLAKLTPAEQAAGGFSGFRLYYPINKANQLDEFISFNGASYFRPLAKDQSWGLSARGIAVDTLGREEFPAFTEFWLVQPQPSASEMTVYALLEGPRITGAYAFRIQPGAETKVHVRAVLFPRKDIKDIGFAPLTSMFWYGENTSNTFGNWRPEVHDSDGLQILRSNGEWIWRPLAWAKQRQVNVYADTNPRGFGLFQRDRDFTHYQDLEAHYHQRPSAWIQPDGAWGEGDVVLMQNAAKDEFMDNVVAYWRPRNGVKAGTRVDMGYIVTMFSANDALPPVARCVSTRIDYQEKPNYRLVVIDFSGGALNGAAPDAKVEADLWTGKNGILSNVQAPQKIPNTETWRMSFGVTSNDDAPVEMRCALKLNGKVATETWNSTWVK